MKSLWLSSLLTLLWLSETRAETPVVVTDVKQVYAVAPHSDFVQSTAGIGDLAKVWPSFRPFDYHQIRLDVDTNNVYWFRFTVRNETDQHVYAVVPTVGFAGIQLYEWEQGRARLIGKGGSQYSLTEKYLFTNDDIMRLSLRKHEQRTYLMRMSRFTRKFFPVFIYPEYALIQNSHKLNTVSGALFGIILAVVLYQLLTYFITREWDYLRLSAYLLFFCIQLTIYSGHFYEAFPMIPFEWNERIYFGLPIVTALLSNTFAYYFLRIRQQGDRYMKIGFRIFFALFSLTFLAACLGLSGISTLYQNAAPLSAAFLLYAGIKLYSRGYKPAFLFLVAYTVPIIAILFLSLYIYGFITYAWSIHNLLLMSAGAHAILFSVAVANKLISYRNQTEQLIKNQNFELEQKVQARTRELAQDKARIEQQSQQLRLVMKELHHRVKNNLSIVSSLLHLQSSRLTDEQAVKAFQEGQQRIEVMSLIHQRLYKTDQISSIDIGPYVQELTTSLIHAYGFSDRQLSFRFHSDYEQISIDLAIPIALILNELLTNAFKYAYRLTDQPRLEIRLLNEDGMVLEVQDNGPGLDLERWHSRGGSFGKRLIGGLTDQLGGQYTMENRHGALFRLHIPVDETSAVLLQG
ncbi:7TM diverse intracellular signaling domain-containing protein [Larkinella sp. VNQ87]|uniref:7TM diverse intracellular signaling domain-containing protein n=1 Tax=Larkinella sp. VNQ87 TaxID=3400921 RepID=UPI003C0F20B4